MKRTLHFLALVLLLNGCTQERSDDASRRKQLAGTWRSPWGGGTVTYITAVSADGHYSRIAVGSNGVELARGEGMITVQDGYLVDTLIKNSETNVPLLRTSRGAIIRANDREWTVKWDSRGISESETIFRKESR